VCFWGGEVDTFIQETLEREQYLCKVVPLHEWVCSDVLKGTGTRDYNWLKVIWYDGSWLGESPADIQKFVNCPLNFVLNEILCRLKLAGFQNRQVGSGWFSKLASWLWPAFKIDELALTCFQKLSAQLREICYPIGAKDLCSPVL
jgi:hypothetical protein